MKEILHNLVNILLLCFCKAKSIDCSGTHVYKYPRRYTYALLKTETGKPIVTMTFYKNKVPNYSICK